MQIKMSGANIIQEVEITICKCVLKAIDKRTGKVIPLTMFIELTDDDQEAKPIAEKVLKKLGFTFYGFEESPITTRFAKDAQELFEIGQAKEAEDLRQP